MDKRDDSDVLHMIEAYTPELGEVLLSATEIQERIRELGRRITADYTSQLASGQSLVLVGALKGVFVFMADLCRLIELPLTVYFLDVAASEAITRQTGLITLSDELQKAIRGQHVLFVEDIVDAGLTLNYALRALAMHEPASLEVCTMFTKEKRRVIETNIRYVGFELPQVYVVGYGLDYRERFRNLPFLAMLKRS